MPAVKYRLLLHSVRIYQPVGEQDNLVLIVSIILQGFSQEIDFVSTARTIGYFTAFPRLTQAEDL